MVPKQQARPGVIRGVPAAADAVRAYRDLAPERRAALDAFVDAARPVIERCGASASIGWRVDAEIPDWVAFVVEAIEPGTAKERNRLRDDLGRVLDGALRASAGDARLQAWVADAITYAVTPASWSEAG